MWTDIFATIPDHVALIVRVYLLGGDVLATIAVGFGIVWESGPLEVHHVAHRLVIWGVVAETLCSVALFTFDEGLNSAQQAKIIALETRLAPRTLTPEQQRTVADVLRPFSGLVSAYLGNPESANLMAQTVFVS